MKPKQLITFSSRLYHQFALGSLILAFSWLSSFSYFNVSAIAASLPSTPIIAASSAANQVKSQVDKVDRAMGNVKDKVDSTSKDTQKKAKDFAVMAKDKASKDVAKTQTSVKDVKSTVDSKARRDIAKTKGAVEENKAAVASRAQQDASKTENVLEKAGNKAEEFASNALDTAKNILGQ
jgi:ElaB/YqjD/DUF883 family membrane-anchored ribosome-binding protein